MKNINYDLVKLLHNKLDTCWRLEKFYCKDALDAQCESISALNKILEDEKIHVEMIRREIEKRIKAGLFS